MYSFKREELTSMFGSAPRFPVPLSHPDQTLSLLWHLKPGEFLIASGFQMSRCSANCLSSCTFISSIAFEKGFELAFLYKETKKTTTNFIFREE